MLTFPTTLVARRTKQARKPVCRSLFKLNRNSAAGESAIQGGNGPDDPLRTVVVNFKGAVQKLPIWFEFDILSHYTKCLDPRNSRTMVSRKGLYDQMRSSLCHLFFFHGAAWDGCNMRLVGNLRESHATALPRKIFITALQFETAAEGNIWRGPFLSARSI